MLLLNPNLSLSCEHQEKDCTVFQGVFTCTVNTQDIKDVYFSTKTFPLSLYLIDADCSSSVSYFHFVHACMFM